MARRKLRRSAAHCKALSFSSQRRPDAREAARNRPRGLELGANAEWLQPSLLLAPVRHVLEALEPTLPPDSEDRKAARWWLERSDKAHRQYLTRHPEVILKVLRGFARDARNPGKESGPRQ